MNEFFPLGAKRNQSNELCDKKDYFHRCNVRSSFWFQTVIAFNFLRPIGIFVLPPLQSSFNNTAQFHPPFFYVSIKIFFTNRISKNNLPHPVPRLLLNVQYLREVPRRFKEKNHYSIIFLLKILRNDAGM